MHSFKKFALVTILSGAAVMPAIAHAANNEDTYKPAAKTTAAEHAKTEMTTGANSKLVVTKNTAKTEDFATMDKDHSGKLNLTEFEDGMKGSHKDAKQKFAALDTNHDRKLTKEEAGTTFIR